MAPSINGTVPGAASLESLDVDDLTSHVIKVSSNIDNERVKFIFSRLIRHSHDFIRETEIQRHEWEAAWEFLTKVGQACHPERQEFILLSDVLGISALVDQINSRQLPGCTESSVLGPFHNESHEFNHGDSISSVGAGESMLIRGTVKNRKGEPIQGALLDIWETNGNGKYDMQDPETGGPDCRGKFYTDAEGRFYINGVRPVDYPVPFDGPVGIVLDLLNRQAYRPAHVHFLINHPCYERLNTALYDRTSPRIFRDPVFGTKSSLVKDIEWVEDIEEAKMYNTKPFVRVVDGRETEGFWLLEHDFILAEAQGDRSLKTHL
ncbi:hypothetical protein AYO21_07690 [Fonsecaea monophora]|uniref:Intradiol ring-cleavage dioxygenases domain-containing protein n=2 Tax=Fonsecaea TaxID=40354 RepID=A0A0D2E3U3_9EURO|nr:uncharacterized protein Z517_00149 [Fonsecaea pedrosoi CBS 271.37]XP_022510052.1 hypothetical protein AYO21_07690 [Fonsecaea monophora]KAH0847701.1 Hydroxyquinol 1,2-dioxygenase [Fonsecaea pedrosoi]KIW84761.1 hypothetical protein Z517_00149 [Fonsecaea pedrosoi CBS 271.37]OAG38100.1 hypothetical protein AYO21_07690 [Fonsecaea monophora]